MVKCAWVLSAALLALGIGWLAGARARDDDEEKAKIEAARKAAPDVEKLADMIGNPVQLKKQADAVVRKYDELLPIMWQMKSAAKGGIQVGAPGTFLNDSIELGLLQLEKKPPTAKDITAQAKDLQRMADIVRGIAEVTPDYGRNFARNAAQQKLWDGFSTDMQNASDTLSAAIKQSNAKAFKKAVNDLNKSCNNCHTLSRDGRPLADVVQAAAVLNKPEQLKARSETLVRLWGLDEISSALKPRGQGGLTPGGIEADLLDLEKHPPTADDLPALAPMLQQAAEMVRAIAEATPDYRQKYTAKPGAPNKWICLTDDMKRGADDLITAVKANDVTAVQKAISALNQSCADCHKAYR